MHNGTTISVSPCKHVIYLNAYVITYILASLYTCIHNNCLSLDTSFFVSFLHPQQLWGHMDHSAFYVSKYLIKTIDNYWNANYALLWRGVYFIFRVYFKSLILKVYLNYLHILFKRTISHSIFIVFLINLICMYSIPAPEYILYLFRLPYYLHFSPRTNCRTVPTLTHCFLALPTSEESRIMRQ